MDYNLTGELCARVCRHVEVPLSGAVVRLYRPDVDDVTRAVAARPKETFRIRSDDEVDSRSDELLAEAEVDADGGFDATIDGDQEDYDGEAFEIDVRISAIDGHQFEPVQVSLTVHQPRWRETQDGAISRWEHCLDPKQWCAILEEVGLWVVAGRVTDCETEEPLGDMEVTVFDADIIQHDELGSDTTNTAGEYVIYYTDADVRRVPFGLTPKELTEGPDIYFHIGFGGTTIDEEEPSAGREPGRENVERCHCEDLCVDFEGPDRPLFTHVGEFNIFQDLASDGTLNKARHGIGGDGWGFHGNVPLMGYVPEVDPSGEQMWYRFLYELFDEDGSSEGTYPLVGDLVSRVLIGVELVSLPPPVHLGIREYFVVGSTPAPDPSLDPQPVYIEPNSDGWVRVPDLHGTALGHGPLMGFATPNAISGGSTSAPTAGTAPAATPEGRKIDVIFETTTGATPSPSDIDTQSQVATMYVNNHGTVRVLDVVVPDPATPGAFVPVGCDVAESAIVRYTADHQFLNSYSVSLASQASGGGGPGSTWPTSLVSKTTMDRASNRPPSPPAATGNAASIDLPVVYDGAGTPGSDYDPFADWPACSYIARLSTDLALTNGLENDDGGITRAVDGVFYKG